MMNKKFFRRKTMSRVRSAEMPSSSNRSTEKALAIIEILAASRTPMRLLDIAKLRGSPDNVTSILVAI